MSKATVALFVALVVSCGPADLKQREIAEMPKSGARIAIASSQIYTDSRGYNRDILILYDMATDKEYLVVIGGDIEEIKSIQFLGSAETE